jgi:fumarylacetoacetate (FAA) hydrolase
MKLGTLRNGRPDGQLVVVSSDLLRCVSAGRIAPSLQAALDGWETARPALEELSGALNAGRIAAQAFDPAAAMAPLPRAFQFIDGAGYLTHLERVRMLRGGRDDDPQARRPVLSQAASDRFAGPTEPIVTPENDLALDFEAEIAVVLGPVPMRPDRAAAADAIRLVGVLNDVTLRRLVADDLQQGFGLFHAKPQTSFAPVLVTPDELGAAWRDAKLHLVVRVMLNDMLFGQPNAGVDMHFDFIDLIVAAAQTRALGNGTILGSGTISNRHSETPPIRREGIGFGCIAEARTLEKLKYGRSRTPFLKPGDRVRIAALDAGERPVFGSIDQTVSLFGRS